nr:TPA: 60S ribosomal protein L13, putative [Toxoplasma gondii VEG]
MRCDITRGVDESSIFRCGSRLLLFRRVTAGGARLAQRKGNSTAFRGAPYGCSTLHPDNFLLFLSVSLSQISASWTQHLGRASAEHLLVPAISWRKQSLSVVCFSSVKMVSKNNVLPNVHLHKWWQRYVKTWFNQPGRKQSRRLRRQEKAAKLGVVPSGLLRPIVHPPTQRYNLKVRAGRGFTLEELKSVGLSPRVALSIGVAVDHRRRNRSAESLNANVTRLKAYLAKLVLFQRGSKAKKGLAGIPADTPKSQIQNVKHVKISTAMPIPKASKRCKPRAITAEEQKFMAYATLRKALRDCKNVGKHEKKLAAEKEANQK